ncbi:MAG: ThuA domain-containing protein [Sphingomonadales bacterium]|nr:ThuA domain-containing protein [Sphingomonadales bacterium]
MQRIDAHLVAAGQYHDIDFARLELLKLLGEQPHVRTTVAMDYGDLDRLAACRFLVTYTCNVLPSPAELAALRTFLDKGGRWLALHGTNSILRFTADGRVDCPDERPDVMALLGTQFKAHPPIGPFRVEVTAPEHPLAAGIGDFDVVDELYLSEPRAPIEVLMQTRFSGTTPRFTCADWPDATAPILYLRQVGKGAILYNTLGHCRGHHDLTELTPFYPHPERGAWAYPVYYELLRRGLRWAQGEA